MRKHLFTLTKALALLAAAALASCNGGGGGSTTPPVGPTPSGSAVLSNIVGVGDSLTAGYQSGGYLGDTTMPDPFFPGINVPPGQESGWWSQFYMQAKGATYLTMANPATSVLPLIKQPGLSNQLVPNNPAVTKNPLPFLPLSIAIPGQGCNAFSQAGYKLSSFKTTRLNPNTLPKDLAIPGITLHEALTMYQPNEPTCQPIVGEPAQLSLLQNILGEAGPFYPVLGNYAPTVQPLTMLNVAVNQRPTLTTVWLGANDVLHYTFSGGTFPGVDTTPAQVQTDMTKIITSLKGTGSAVVVANLPDVLETPFFFSMSVPSNPAATCPLQSNLFCLLTSKLVGLPPSFASQIVTSLATQYGLSNGGYITVEGLFAELQASPVFSADLNKLSPSGNGDGSFYVTPGLAAKVQKVNDALNSGINAAATANGVALVDIQTVFKDIYNGNTSDPYAAMALTVSPGKCCSLAYYGGLVSFDGLHPSNTGYALIADAFIQAVDAKYGTTVPPIDITSVYNGTGNIPFPDPYAQH